MENENAEMEEKDFELFVHFAELEVMRVVDPERYHKTAVRIAVAFLNSIDVDYTPIEIAFCRAVVGDSQEPGNQK